MVYHYKAVKGDSYAFEAYLEFKISDKKYFLQYIDAISNSGFVTSDCNNCSFLEYTVSDIYSIDITTVNPIIQKAKIGKILYSAEEQTVIFWALGVYDGGSTKVTDLDYFFSKFEIDPIDYNKVLYHNTITHNNTGDGSCSLYQEIPTVAAATSE